MSLTDNRIIDRYPTRTLAPAPHRRRTDPTVWGTIESDGLDTFDADGFAIVPQLLDRGEVTGFAAEVSRLTSDPELMLDERLVIEKGSRRVRSIFAVHELSSMVADLVRESRIAGLARQILGSEVYLHQSRINYMPGLSGAGFSWHSDFETWHAEDGMPAPRAVSVSIALTENFPFNGSLMLMPGSHRTFVPCQGETPPNHYRESLRSQEVGVPRGEDIVELAARCGITQFTGTPGAALVFDSNVMHGSANNITPFPRSNIFLVFNSVENALVEPFAADEPRPSYIANRDFTPVV